MVVTNNAASPETDTESHNFLTKGSLPNTVIQLPSLNYS